MQLLFGTLLFKHLEHLLYFSTSYELEVHICMLVFRGPLPDCFTVLLQVLSCCERDIIVQHSVSEAATKRCAGAFILIAENGEVVS